MVPFSNFYTTNFSLMKQQKVGIIIFSFLFLFTSFLVIKIVKRASRFKMQHVGTIIDSNYLNDASLLLGSKINMYSRKVLLVQFSPDCENCQIEAEQIVKRNDTATCFIFSSNAPLKSIGVFIDKYELRSIKNCLVVFDEGNHIARMIDCHTIPSFILYDKNHALKKKFCGSIKLSILLDD